MGERALVGLERRIGGQRDARREHLGVRQRLPVLVELDEVGDPLRGGVAQDRVDSHEVDVAWPPERHVHFPHRLERRADQERQPLAFRSQEGLNRHLVGDFVCPWLGREQRDEAHEGGDKAAHGRTDSIGLRSTVHGRRSTGPSRFTGPGTPRAERRTPHREPCAALGTTHQAPDSARGTPHVGRGGCILAPAKTFPGTLRGVSKGRAREAESPDWRDVRRGVGSAGHHRTRSRTIGRGTGEKRRAGADFRSRSVLAEADAEMGLRTDHRPRDR